MNRDGFDYLIRKPRSVYHVIRNHFWAWIKYRKAADSARSSLRGQSLKTDGHSPAQKKKIIVVSHSAVRSGAPMLALHIVKELKKQGWEVFTVLLEPGEMTSEFFRETPACWGINRFYLRHWFSELKRKGFKLCLCNSALSGPAAYYAAKNGMKTISLVHELPKVLTIMDAYKKAVQSWRWSDKVIFPSSVVKKAFLGYIKVAADSRAIVMPQGIYHLPARLLSKDDARRRIEKYLGKKLQERLIINIATVSERKGYDLFLRLSVLCPDSSFLWVGIEKNIYYYQCMKKISCGKNYAETGFIRDTDLLYAFYCAADMMILSSREEPMASTVMEALYTGTPVTAFRSSGGVVDIITDGFNGFLVDEVCPEALRDKVYEYYRLAPQERHLMEDNCRRSAAVMNFGTYVDSIIRFFSGS